MAPLEAQKSGERSFGKRKAPDTAKFSGGWPPRLRQSG
jgi:hypothetical protein